MSTNVTPEKTRPQAGTPSVERAAAANPLYRAIKTSTTLRIDADVVAWLRSSGPGWQTRINAILREAMLDALDVEQQPK